MLSPEERSIIYQRLAQVFSYPGEEDYAGLVDDSYLEPFLLLGRDVESLLSKTSYPVSLEELQQQYTGLFDVGRGGSGPPCPLYEGPYRPDWGRSKIFEELLRFYDFFGLELSPDSRELPDHLTVELEFMHFLTFQEASSEDPAPFQRAQRDFLNRHLVNWVPMLRQRIDEVAISEYFKAQGFILESFIRTEIITLQDVT